MKALVIGGTGHTGPYLVDGLMHRGYEVAIFHRGTHEVELPEEVEHIHGDPHFLETIGEALGDRQFDVVIATYGRLRHISEFMKSKTQRFIAIGGVGLYKGYMDPAHNPPGGIKILTPEEGPIVTDPEVMHFSYLMYLAEQAVIQAHNEGCYNATIFRYPMVYGPRQIIPLEWSVIRRILDGQKYIFIPDGGLTIDSRGYAENMAYAVLLAVDKPEESAGQIYNAGDEELFSLYEWVMMITDIMDYEWEIVNIPGEIARPCQPFLGMSGATTHKVFDIAKIQKELEYKDLIPPKEALRQTVQWYLENKPERGGEIEKRLRDPFNYEAEDKILKAYKESIDRILRIPYPVDSIHHPYAHPKVSRKKRDHRER
jgi:nucleoside-diphosphate-sugar epimerase